MTTAQINGPRGCTRQELGQMIEMADAVFRPDGRQTLLNDYPLVYRDDNLANVRILTAGGQIASVVPFIPWTIEHEGCRFTISIISPTATDENHRLKGYGLQCLNSCIACMEEQGIDLSVLWTMVPTFRFYNHCDYQAVRDQCWNFACRRADAALFNDHGETVVPYDPTKGKPLSAIGAMRAAQPFGLVRSDDRARVLFALAGLTTTLALRGGTPAAYLCVFTPSNKRGIIEGGGDIDALETLVHHALSKFDEDEVINARTELCPTALDQLLYQNMPDRRSPSGNNTMIRINNIPGFFRKIAPWLARRNDGRTESFSIGVSDADTIVSFDFTSEGLTIAGERHPAHIELSRLDLVSAIFGPHPQRPYEIPEPLARLFPFHFPISILDRS